MINQDLQDLTQTSIYKNYDYVKSLIGNNENYHNRTKLFANDDDEVEIYFEAKSETIELYQVETFNKFIRSIKRNEIENYIFKSYTDNEIDKNRNGKISKTYFEIIQVPIDNNNFDLVLVCSKEYKKTLVF